MVESQSYAVASSRFFKRIDPAVYEQFAKNRFQNATDSQTFEEKTSPSPLTSSVFFNRTTKQFLVIRPDLFMAELSEITQSMTQLGISSLSS